MTPPDGVPALFDAITGEQIALAEDIIVKTPRQCRIAGMGDEAVIMEMLMRFAEESSLGKNVDCLKVLAEVRAMLGVGAEVQGGFIGIAEDYDGTPCGTIALKPGQWWYTQDWHLEEMWNYVLPEHRGKDAYWRCLLKWASSVGNLCNMPVLFGVMSRERTEAKCRLIKRYIPQIGGLFIYEPKKPPSMRKH